ncbi:MarR family transcriptional regulator [Rhizobium leguminosarum bv. viciae]|uniref:MarR family winged helix-turn-helix transcriptional regulator n=1 Tax=Rhizobium leguminosarum TaxID=384 RepID=UPI001442158E|nr:MarR family winged helix-turn-helix transcriptional regulator [Rhizobium leguminosarum]NKL02798.1 MarR family transcriptional regulator [Rhizobium leguminosarum bv. viciae]
MVVRTTPLGLLIGRTAKRVNGAFERALADAGATVPAWLVIMNLARHGPLRQTDLAERLGVTGPTMSHHLEMLSDRNWITRERPADNRRTQIVTLTDEGRRMFVRLRSVAQGHDRNLRRGLTEEEEQALRNLLIKVAANISQ